MFNRIKIGMTRAQARAILGAPTRSSRMQFSDFPGTAATWKAPEGTTIRVQFPHGKVQAKPLHSQRR